MPKTINPEAIRTAALVLEVDARGRWRLIGLVGEHDQETVRIEVRLARREDAARAFADSLTAILDLAEQRGGIVLEDPAMDAI
jgi:hypothetical protein